MSDPEADVLVVGAGPSGLALALQARDHGARVRVVERRGEPFRPSRALIVHPRTLEVLRPLGVTDALLAHGNVAPSVHLHLGRREVPVTLGDFALPDTPFPYLLFERQSLVEQVLSDALAARGVQVERGAELVDTRTGPDRMDAVVRRAGVDACMSCSYLAGCDGSASTVRRLAGVPRSGGPYRQEVVLADVELEAPLEPQVAHVVAGRNGLLFLFALGEGAPWRMLATRRAPVDTIPLAEPNRSVPVDELQSLVDDSGLDARIEGVAWSGRVRLEHRIARSYRVGRLFLVGDAAHVHSPAGGQGMNTGIQDAVNLGWKLAFAARRPQSSGPARDPLLDSYEQERRPVAHHVLAMTHVLFWAEAATTALPSFARGVLAPLAAPLVPHVLGSRRIVAAGIRTLSQLRVGYRHSVLSVDRPASWHGLRPGERLPDGAVTVAGRRARLHELLAAPGVHVLLGRDAAPIEDADLGPLVQVHRVLDWPGEGALVVRPDGYVGLRAAAVSVGQIRGWLDLVRAPTRQSRLGGGHRRPSQPPSSPAPSMRAAPRS